MSKGSWKLRGLPGAAEAVQTSPSLRAAATKLGVHVSTLSRAVKAGHLPGRSGAVPRAAALQRKQQPTAEPHPTFAHWARETYTLSRAEDELVTLAQQALDLARDPGSSPTTKLQAAAQYRATLRDLNLPDEDTRQHGDPETTVRQFRRA